jgi:hypothetical protein
LRTGGSSRGDNGTVETGLGNDVDLDSGIATRVVDVASVDLADRHGEKISGRPGELGLAGWL